MSQGFRFDTTWNVDRPKDGTECKCGTKAVMCMIINADTGDYCCDYCEHLENVE